MKSLQYAKMVDLKFEDLYMNQDDELYPNIRQAINKLSHKIRNIKNNVHTMRRGSEDGNFLGLAMPETSFRAQHVRRHHS